MLFLKLVVLVILTSYWLIFASTGINVTALDQIRNFLYTVAETGIFFPRIFFS